MYIHITSHQTEHKMKCHSPVMNLQSINRKRIQRKTKHTRNQEVQCKTKIQSPEQESQRICSSTVVTPTASSHGTAIVLFNNDDIVIIKVSACNIFQFSSSSGTAVMIANNFPLAELLQRTAVIVITVAIGGAAWLQFHISIR